MKAIKRLTNLICLAALLVAGLWSNIRYIEPNRLEIKEINLVKEGTYDYEPRSIVQFSDTHLGHEFDLDELERLVDKINKQKPDLIVFTGDLIDNTALYEDRNGISAVLSKLKSKYGKFAIWGNHDYGGGGTNYYARIMGESGFTVLKNNHERIELEDGRSINMIGLDDGLLGKPDVEKAFKSVQEADYNVLFMHEPDLMDEALDQDVDLALAGHSHGGQIKLPFIGPVLTPVLAKHYTHGLYELEPDQYLYVNTGIGTTKIGVRFLNPPEITVFKI